jgi:hypothetical protein
MHAQLATREAEEQSLQLADMLTTALQQLGIEITPAKQPAAAVSPMLTPPPGGQGQAGGRGGARLLLTEQGGQEVARKLCV